jgi:hypothetical protein
MRNRRRLAFGKKDLIYYRQKSLAPQFQGSRVVRAKTGKRFKGFFERCPPFKGSAILQDKCYVQLGFQINRSVSQEFQITVPGHLIDGAMIERMRVVQKSGMHGLLFRGESTSGTLTSVYRENLHPGLPQIRLQHEAVVSCPQDDTIILFHAGNYFINPRKSQQIVITGPFSTRWIELTSLIFLLKIALNKYLRALHGNCLAAVRR